MNGYKAFAQVLDWGGHVTKMIVPLPETVTAADPADFTAYVQKIDPETGLVAMMPRSMFTKSPLVPSVGEMTFQAAYPCDEKGERADRSDCVALIPNYGPLYPASSLHILKRGYTTFSDPRYTVCWKGQVVANRGSLTLEGRELVRTGAAASGLKYAWAAPQIENEKPPVVIWLHGAGEGGWDPYIAVLGNKVINISSPRIQGYFGGAYLFAPQCPTMWMDDGSGQYHREGKSMYVSRLKATIDEFLDAHPEIDRDRVYIGGCSNGGFMTMRMVIDYPDFFAAAYPVCEALYDETISDGDIQKIAHLPIWFTHAASDMIVPPAETAIPTYRRLKAAGAENVHFSYYERVLDQTGMFHNPDGSPYEYFGHGSWIYTLNDDCRLDFDGSEVTVDGKPVTIFQWLAMQHK